jgi:hypothetical protein
MAAIWNYSSYNLWVVETDTGPAIAHLLPSMYRSPFGVDADGVKGYSTSINGYSGWWKTKAGATADLRDNGGEIALACGGVGVCYQVPDNEFGGGNISYDSTNSWGIHVSQAPAPCLFTASLVVR